MELKKTLKPNLTLMTKDKLGQEKRKVRWDKTRQI